MYIYQIHKTVKRAYHINTIAIFKPQVHHYLSEHEQGI
jgi:hypothetical protein